MEGNLTFTELETAATQQTTATSAEQTAAATTTETKVEETKPQFTEADVEAYKSLVDMGITPQTAADFKAAKTALDNLPALLDSNPDLLMDEIEKNNPELHKKLLEKMSDRWFNRLPAEVRNPSANGSSSRTAESTPAVDPRLTAIEAKLDRFIQKENQEESTRRQTAISEGYKVSVDGLLGKLPEAVSQKDRDYIRLKTNELLWADSKARDRIAAGVYVDVPTYFSKASSLVTAETKAASSAEHDRRAGVEARGVREIPAAADNVNGSASSKQEGHGHDPIWGNISDSELKSAYK
jgi:hypothetical protein